MVAKCGVLSVESTRRTNDPILGEVALQTLGFGLEQRLNLTES
jgi:hypothetical protein